MEEGVSGACDGGGGGGGGDDGGGVVERAGGSAPAAASSGSSEDEAAASAHAHLDHALYYMSIEHLHDADSATEYSSTDEDERAGVAAYSAEAASWAAERQASGPRAA